MNKLMEKLGIDKSQVVSTTPARQKGKETTDTELLRSIRQQMNNVFISNASIVNSGTYYLPIYKRDANKKILLDKHNNKVVEGYNSKSLTGQHILEDNGDGTHTATKFNVFKETIQVDSNSLNVTEITNGKS